MKPVSESYFVIQKIFAQRQGLSFQVLSLSLSLFPSKKGERGLRYLTKSFIQVKSIFKFTIVFCLALFNFLK